MSIYVGQNGIAREVKDIYVGVNGVARKVTNGYVGVNGVAREIYSSSKGIVTITVGRSGYRAVSYGYGSISGAWMGNESYHTYIIDNGVVSPPSYSDGLGSKSVTGYNSYMVRLNGVTTTCQVTNNSNTTPFECLIIATYYINQTKGPSQSASVNYYITFDGTNINTSITGFQTNYIESTNYSYASNERCSMSARVSSSVSYFRYIT